MALLVVTLLDSGIQRSIVVMLLRCRVTARTSYDIVPYRHVKIGEKAILPRVPENIMIRYQARWLEDHYQQMPHCKWHQAVITVGLRVPGQQVYMCKVRVTYFQSR
ncbi:hypothetical protein E2C01_094040 [Portunus trituberculatus]|uniref:Uncharacterized protein n=1 Tax=Portunus trituberculatus TaxID=210409 RepID=A0A5B7JKP4_PORTR|nr:hypothetical protein [Portunus trituberculatus]